MRFKRSMLLVFLVGACSTGEDTDAPSMVDSGNCRPFRAQPLNVESGCLEDTIAFRCDNGGCDEVNVDAVDAEGNCYRMLGCPPSDWKNSLEDELPQQCEAWFSLETLPMCSELGDANVRDAADLDAADLDAACLPYRAQRLNVESQCLEDVIEFGCNDSGCDDATANAVDDEGNCYRMLGCSPPQWQSSIEDTLPEQCDGLSFDHTVPLCSAILDAGDGG